jgi:YfiH family protein
VPVELTLTPESRGPLSVYPIKSVRQFDVVAFVTDRFGGVSEPPYNSLNLATHVGDRIEHVRENRQRVANAIDVDPAHLITISQVHGTDVVDVDVDSSMREGDGLVSARGDLALAILVADCVPILLVDDASTKFGVVHAGWRGLAGGVLKSALAHFVNPGSVHAVLGPCISMAGYQVGPEVAAHFIAIHDALRADEDDRSRLDLRHVVASQLRELGVVDQHVTLCRQSTDGGEVFYSDRAQRPCGRFALVAKRSSHA